MTEVTYSQVHGSQGNILNPICHAVVSGSSDFRFFLCMSFVKIKSKCIWVVKYEAISWKTFIQVIQIEKPGVENLTIIRIQNQCRFCNTKIILY